MPKAKGKTHSKKEDFRIQTVNDEKSGLLLFFMGSKFVFSSDENLALRGKTSRWSPLKCKK
jgi:ethanolamine utilization cobalamin adenosyltransferase